MTKPSISLITLLVGLGFAPTLHAQQKCEDLAHLTLRYITVTSAQALPAGRVPGGYGEAPPVEVPPRCVVQGVARPTSDSEIKFEVWMPLSGWNGKYQQQGNGGWAGSIPVSSLAYAVRRGYATAGTDDGHTGSPVGADWAVGHPEKLIDFGHRAVHETREAAGAVVAAFYGRPAARNYFSGCSDGGREALMEAQRYPEDFDGILAGAPANDWSHLFAGFVWNEQALLNDTASAIPTEKLPAIQKAAVTTCDALDGVVDGLVEDPRACHFDPAVLLCKNEDGNECLTRPQVEALAKIYAGPKNSRTGASIYPGFAPGTEATPNSWRPWIIAQPPQNALQFYFGNSYFGQAVFENPKWDFRTLNFDADIALSDEKAGVVVNSSNPDLRSFRARGGKLIQYHGWGDAAIPAQASIDYYERVRAFLKRFPDARTDAARPVEDFYRLFLVPGMGHCGAGFGPVSFGNGGLLGVQIAGNAERDVTAALERWVEQGVAPDHLIGTGPSALDPKKQLSRPLCVYPQVAKYKGTGDADDAANFVCAAPK